MNFLAIMGLLAQAPAQAGGVIEATEMGGDHNLISLVLHANTVVQLTLLLLVIFSVVSWAIIGSKHRQLKNAKKRSDRFYQLFWQSKSIDAIVSKGSFRKSPAFSVFKAGIDTLRENQTKSPHSAIVVEKEIRRAAEDEIAEMEYGVPFLATTGSAAPFIGLFGTVWGILNAFWKIGRTGATSLAIVGPHIAEALIATAIGLAAAIPAVIFYNIYVNKIRLVSKDLIDFTDDFWAKINREYFS
ncbi:MAG: MotA/TolQ/ExbB proton channel family protein [Pseudomonadota bacterium]